MISAADKLRMQGERDLFKRITKGKFSQIDNELIELIDKADIEKVEKAAENFNNFNDIHELKQQLK